MDANNGSAPVYVNFGGIGLLSGRTGSLGISAAARMQLLRLIPSFERAPVWERPAPPAGWDDESLASALREASDFVAAHSPVDAWLGDKEIGGTEL
jgi:hypothetical protein